MMDNRAAMVAVEVHKVLFDPEAGAAALVLRENAGKRRLLLWIGAAEAMAIASAIEGVRLARPMTHDLLADVIEELGAMLVDVRVHSLVEGTYHAVAEMRSPAGPIRVDCRPSDGIAIALRMDASIHVGADLLERGDEAKGPRPISISEKADGDAPTLEDLPDEIFGKYKM
jgi:uncharacterized protein